MRNPNAYLADEERLNKELTLMSWLRNNWGWLLIKKDQRIGQLDTTLTDFDAVTMLGYQVVAAISGIPSARLLETSPKGWQSTGSYEDDNYRKLQQGIQNIDYVPILNFHYRLLAKSKLGIDKEYSCVFNDIDTPTEKERAEIREINSRTDATYINAGVVSPEEIRGVLRADEKSGYNVLSEEMEGESTEGEGDPFADLTGGGENSQDPFSVNTFNLDEWKENEHPRDKEGKFTTGSSQNTGTKSDVKTNEPSKLQISKTTKTIAGVKPGKPMSFKEANEGKVNPNYSKGGIYRINCQSSVAVFEARLRGYDIETKGVNPETIRDLSFEPNLAYIDPQTGKNPQFVKSHTRNSNDCKKWLDEQIKPGERYAFGYSPELSINDNGHIITVYKTNDGVLKFYDPQKGKNYDVSFLDNIGYETPFGNIIICFSPMIFRIDDKELNYDILEKISQPSKKQDN